MVMVIALLEPRPAMAKIKNSDRSATKTLSGYPCPAPSQHTKSEMKNFEIFPQDHEKTREHHHKKLKQYWLFSTMRKFYREHDMKLNRLFFENWARGLNYVFSDYLGLKNTKEGYVHDFFVCDAE